MTIKNADLSSNQKKMFTILAKYKREEKAAKAKATKQLERIIKEFGEDNLPKRFDLRGDEKLIRTIRDNWSTPNSDKVLDLIGKAAFLKHACMTKAKVEAAGGTVAVDKLVRDGDLKLTSTSRYYTLK